MEPIGHWLQWIEGITAAAAVIIAYFAHQLTKNQRVDTWTRALHELHGSFWTDADYRHVRHWIASTEGYKELDSILAKRLEGRAGLSEAEYVALERLDKFFNLLLRARAITERLHGKQDLWSRLYFQYWIDDIIRAQRHNLWKYFQRFYEAHADFPVTVPPDDRDSFEKECEQ